MYSRVSVTCRRHTELDARGNFDPVQEAQRPGSGAAMNYRGPTNGARRFSGTDRYPLHGLVDV